MIGSNSPLTPFANTWAKYLFPWVKSEAVYISNK